MSNPWSPHPTDEDGDVLFGDEEESWRGDVHLEDDETWRPEATATFEDTEEYDQDEAEGDEPWASDEQNEWPEWLADPEYWLYEDRDEGDAAA